MRDPMSDLLHQIEEELNRDVFDLVKVSMSFIPVLRGSSEYETILNTLSTNISATLINEAFMFVGNKLS